VASDIRLAALAVAEVVTLVTTPVKLHVGLAEDVAGGDN
jgi:hypothetical protein